MSIEGTGTGKWSQSGVPHKDWFCVDVEQLDEQEHVCEMCEVQLVRFVHVMQHTSYPQQLRVGCVCAGHMEGNLAAARGRETGFKNRLSRRARWLERRWRRSSAGNEFINTNDGFNVVVFRNGSTWAARVEHRPSRYARRSKLPYDSVNAAKLAAFDAMLKLKHLQPWQRLSMRKEGRHAVNEDA